MALRLRHIHLPGLPSYAVASEIQELLRRRLLDSKDATDPRRRRPPPPTLLSFTPAPTYTLGRRQSLADLTPSEAERLTQPLRIVSSQSVDASDAGADAAGLRPTVVESPRGGLTTYHGPRQVVLWPILDLKSEQYKQFSVRCYSRLLEDVTIATLRRRWGIEGFTTEDPGVWVWARQEPGASSAKREAAKISALGVHLRRHVSASGVAINIDLPRWRVGDPPTLQDLEENPWARIVACGLEGKRVTSVVPELASEEEQHALALGMASSPDKEGRAIAWEWAAELARRLELGDARNGQVEAQEELVDMLDEPVVSEMLRAVERRVRA
ncbi:hypothetical protein GQ53DRAFT_659398 [Thozetella sp. PMI_491]|nr:hypothetical protein GQ53DRAFT_659398 [Thozetella sp. PMI_491]